MCGIAGWVAAPLLSVGQHALSSVGRSLAHRGPDGEGLFQSRSRDGRYRVALVHRRLAIIDVAGGVQPMRTADGHVTLVYNGEIYNFMELRAELSRAGHAFETRSDTEVLLRAYLEWGVGAIARFRGMFAFAIWDGRDEKLILARDPFGKKPLYLYRSNGSILFASEIEALRASGVVDAEIDTGSIREYLVYRYVPGPRTLFRGITKLMPGCYAVWQQGRLEQTRYHVPPDRSARTAAPQPADPVAAFASELEEAVRVRMVSDVPFGAFLSGGIDSSAVVALMARNLSRKVDTFSVEFREAAFNELDYAALASRHLGTNHHELIVTPRDVADQLPKLVAHRGAPVAEPSDIAIHLLAAEAAKTVKMVVTGEGSDEILGGYPKHIFEHYAAPAQAMAPDWLLATLFGGLAGMLPYRARRLNLLLTNLALPDFADRMPRWFGAMSPAEVRQALAPFATYEDPAASGSDWPLTASGAASPLRRVLFFDQASWLPDNLLERGDRMTMAASLEARMPFVDVKLAAFVSSLPDRFRVRRFRGKWILRQAMRGILPDRILYRPKKGFAVPVGDWFRNELRDFVCDNLGRAHVSGYFRKNFIENTLAEHFNGVHNHQKLIWTLLTLEIFHSECGRHRPVPASAPMPALSPAAAAG